MTLVDCCGIVFIMPQSQQELGDNNDIELV